MGACAYQGQTSCNCIVSGQETSQRFRAIQRHASCSATMSDSKATNEGKEEVPPFTPEQIQWIDRLIAFHAALRSTSTSATPSSGG